MTRVRALVDFLCAVNVILTAAGAEHHGDFGGFLSEPEKMALEDYCLRGGTPADFCRDLRAARAHAQTEIDQVIAESFHHAGV